MPTAKIVVVGDEHVGKSCLIVTHSTGLFPHDRIPIVLKMPSEYIDEDSDKVTKIVFYDTFGAKEYDYARHCLYTGTDVFLICFSLVDHSSFQNVLTRWYPEVRKNCSKTPIILVGLKSDLNDSTSITNAEGLSMAYSIGAIGYLECSAITKKGFSELNKLLNATSKHSSSAISSSTIAIELTEVPKKSSIGTSNCVVAVILLSLVVIVLLCPRFFHNNRK